MQIKKAVITAAGRGIRQYPASSTVLKAMLPMVDRDGLSKPIVQIIAEEAIESGIESIAVVTAPGDEEQYRHEFKRLTSNILETYRNTDWAREQARRIQDLESRLTFITQDKPEGYGHAVWCARDFVGDEPFLLLLGDHLYISQEEKRCAIQVIDLAQEMNCAVSAVHATREHLIHRYGTVHGKRIPGQSKVYQIDLILEKPSLSVAEQKLMVPGLRIGEYLCFFGIHVLTPTLFAILDRTIGDNRRNGGEIQLTPALQELADREKYLALETSGRRYDVGVPFGSVEAQIALALAGVNRDKMLTLLVETLLQQEKS